MNVYNNIAFPLKMRKVHKDKINESVHKIARLLNIDNLLDRKPRKLVAVKCRGWLWVEP